MSPMENRKVQLLITQGKSFDLRLRVGLGGEWETGPHESAVARGAVLWLCGG